MEAANTEIMVFGGCWVVIDDGGYPPIPIGKSCSRPVLAFDAFTGDNASAVYVPGHGWAEVFELHRFSPTGWLPWTPTHWLALPPFPAAPMLEQAGKT